MKHLAKIAPLIILLLSLNAECAWWAQNDFVWGSNDFKKNSLSFFKTVSSSSVIGLNASLFENDTVYSDKVYSLKFPLLHSSRFHFFSFTPFYYPKKNGSKALGAKFYYMRPVGFDSDEDYTHLIFSISAANQDAPYASHSQIKSKNFSIASFETQIEKNYYNQFFFLASGALFHKFGNLNPNNLTSPSFDYGDMAFIGTFSAFTKLPLWTVNIQFARNTGDDKNSFMYLSLGRTKVERLKDSSSVILGSKVKLTPKSSLDFAYNWLKFDGINAKNYYKLYVQVFF